MAVPDTLHAIVVIGYRDGIRIGTIRFATDAKTARKGVACPLVATAIRAEQFLELDLAKSRAKVTNREDWLHTSRKRDLDGLVGFTIEDVTLAGIGAVLTHNRSDRVRVSFAKDTGDMTEIGHIDLVVDRVGNPA